MDRFYSDEEKKLLGKYIRYYRCKHKIKYDNFRESFVCGHQTLLEIEKGLVKKDDELYDRIMSFMKMEYHLNEDDFCFLKEWIDDLFDACDFHDLNKIVLLEQQFYEKYQEKCIFIDDIKEILHLVHKFYIQYEMLESDEMKRCLDLCKVYDSKLNSIMIEMCARSNFVLVCDQSFDREIIKRVHQNDRILKYWVAHYCLMEAKVLEAFKCYEEIYQEACSYHNHYKRIRVLMDMQAIARELDRSKAKKITNELIELMKNEEVPIDLQIAFLYNLGMYYYKNKNYEEAYNWFKKRYLCKSSFSALFLCFASASHLNKTLDFDYSDIFEESIPYPIFIRFFDLKNKKESELKLENFIFKEVIKELKSIHYYEPHWRIFEYEIEILCSKTRNYKNMKKFKELMNKYVEYY